MGQKFGTSWLWPFLLIAFYKSEDLLININLSIPVLLLLLVLLLFTIYVYDIYAYWKRLGVPCSKPSFFVGHTLQRFGITKSAYQVR